MRMIQKLLPPQTAEEFSDFFRDMHNLTAGEVIGVVYNAFGYIASNATAPQLQALWRTLDFFEEEVPPADKHRIKALRRAILDRLRSIHMEAYANFSLEGKHK